MSKKKKKQYKKRPNYQPESEVKAIIGEVDKEKFVECLKLYPEDFVEYVRNGKECQRVSGYSIQPPIAGNMYCLKERKASERWVDVIADFGSYMTREFTTRLFFVPVTKTFFVATDASVEEIENICRVILHANGYCVDFLW